MEARITKRTIFDNILVLLSGNAFGQISIAFALLLAVRAMGLSNTGQYLACFALAKLTSVLFEFGLDTWLLKEGSSSPSKLGEMVSNNIGVKLGFGIPWLGGLIGLSILLNNETYPLNLVIIAALTTWLESLISTVMSGFKATLSNQKVAVVTVLSSSLLLALTAVLILMHYNSPYPYAIVRLSIGAVFALISMVWFSRSNQFPVYPHRLKRTLFKSRVYFFSDAMTTVYTQADITIVAIFLGKSATGMYGSASKIIGFLFLVPYSIFSVMVPVLSNMYSKGHEGFMRTIRRMMSGMTFVGATMWLIIGLLSTPVILFVLGHEYIVADRILNIMSPILFTKALSFGVASILIAIDWQKYRVWIQALVASVNIILNLLLVVQYGVDGVAWIYLISEIVLFIGYIGLVYYWQENKKKTVSSSDVGL